MGLIYLDACLVIYATENHPVWFKPVREALTSQPEQQFAISPLVKMECLVKPIWQGDTSMQWRYEAGMAQFVQLALNQAVFLQSRPTARPLQPQNPRCLAPGVCAAPRLYGALD